MSLPRRHFLVDSKASPKVGVATSHGGGKDEPTNVDAAAAGSEAKEEPRMENQANALKPPTSSAAQREEASPVPDSTVGQLEEMKCRSHQKGAQKINQAPKEDA